MPQEAVPPRHQRYLAVIFLLTVAASVVVLRYPEYVDPHYLASGAAKNIHFWVGTFAGDWAPPQHWYTSSAKDKPVSDLWFVISGICAIVLNFSPLVAILIFVRRLFNQLKGKRIMTELQLLSNRDTIIMASLLAVLPAPEGRAALLKTLQSAFKEGSEKWEERYLSMTLSPEQAQAFRAHMKEGQFSL